MVEAAGQQILLRDLEAGAGPDREPPDRDGAAGDDRARAPSGCASRRARPRLLKTLEEPPPRSHIILVSDHPADLLDTIRSRCLPVPFRAAGWQADGRGRRALRAAMRAIGVELALAALAGEAPSPGRLVRELQARMEARRRREPLARAAGPARRGRGPRRQARRPHRRQARRGPGEARAPAHGHRRLDASCSTRPRPRPADALAVAVGAEAAVRHPERLEELRAIGLPERREFLERAVAEIQLTRVRAGPQPERRPRRRGAPRAPRRRPPRPAPARLVGHGRLPF